MYHKSDGKIAFPFPPSPSSLFHLLPLPAATFRLPIVDFADPAGASDMPAINAPGHWDVFISHSQRDGNATTLAVELYFSLKERGLAAWLDVKMSKRDVAAMEEGAKNATMVIAIVTDGGIDKDNEDTAFFRRKYCVQELKWAKSAGMAIQPVIRVDDKKRVGEFIASAPGDLKDIGKVDWVHLDRGDNEYWDVGVNKLVKRLEEARVARPMAREGRSNTSPGTGSSEGGITVEQVNAFAERKDFSKLTDALKNGSMDIKERAAHAMWIIVGKANGSEMIKRQSELARAGAILPLIDVIRYSTGHASHGAKEKAAAALANLADGHRENQNAMLKVSVVKILRDALREESNTAVLAQMLRLLKHLVDDCRDAALQVLSMIGLPELIRQLQQRQGAIKEYAEFVLRELKLAKPTKADIDEFKAKGDYRALFRLLDSSKAHESIEALRVIALEEKNRAGLMEAGIVDVVAKQLEHGDSYVKEIATGVVWNMNMSTDAKRQTAFGSAGLIRPIVLFLDSANDGQARRSSTALRYLVVDHQENKKLVVEAGGIPRLVRMLRERSDADARESAARVLYCLASGGFSDQIIDKGGGDALKSVLPKEYAVDAIARLAENATDFTHGFPLLFFVLTNKAFNSSKKKAALEKIKRHSGGHKKDDALIAAGGVPALVAIIDGQVPDMNSSDMKCLALEILADFAGTWSAHKQQVCSKANALRILVNFLHLAGIGASTQSITLDLIRDLVRDNSTVKKEAIKAGVVLASLEILRSSPSDSTCEFKARLVLLDFTEDFKDSFLECGAIPKLIGIIRSSGNSDVKRRRAAWVLWKLLQNHSDSKKEAFKADGINALLIMVKQISDGEGYEAGAEALFCLASQYPDEVARARVSGGSHASLVLAENVLKHSSGDSAKESAVKAIGRLAQMTKGIDEFLMVGKVIFMDYQYQQSFSMKMKADAAERIRIFCDESCNLRKDSKTNAEKVYSSGIVPQLYSYIKILTAQASDDELLARENCMFAVCNIAYAVDSEKKRSMGKASIERLGSVLGNSLTYQSKPSDKLIRLIVWTLHNFAEDQPDNKKLMVDNGVIPWLFAILKDVENNDAKLRALKTLCCLANGLYKSKVWAKNQNQDNVLAKLKENGSTSDIRTEASNVLGRIE